MKRPDIEKLEQLEKASTEGPWGHLYKPLSAPIPTGHVFVLEDLQVTVADCCSYDKDKVANAAFIVEAKNQMPALIEYVKWLEGRLKLERQKTVEMFQRVFVESQQQPPKEFEDWFAENYWELLDDETP